MHWAYPSPTNNDNPYLATMSRVYVSIQRWTRHLHLLLLLLRGRIDVDYIWRRTHTAFVTKCNETDLILQTGDLETRSFDQGWMEQRIRIFIWQYIFRIPYVRVQFSRNTVTKYMVMRCMLTAGTRHHLLDVRVDLFCGNLRVCRIAGRKIPGKCTLIQGRALLDCRVKNQRHAWHPQQELKLFWVSVWDRSYPLWNCHIFSLNGSGL